MLLGRQPECAALETLVERVRASESRVLVVRGEAGIGKTVLLDHLVRLATGCRVLRAAGVEAEMELPFAGLHALCAPLLGRLRRIPAPQYDALQTAFGLASGPRPERFMVGLAVLSLLADAAEDEPLVCVVDDAQWLDRVSAQTLAFVARRVLAERIGIVIAVRTDGTDDPFPGLPELAVEGLSTPNARALLDATVPGPLDDRVRERILAEASGNPLALLELPRVLPLAGGFGLPRSMPLLSRIEQGFARQLEPLPDDTRQLLLLAAADPVGDVTLLRRGAERLGIDPESVFPAEAAGLIDIGAHVRFRHPLVRSAAYRAASVRDRRDVHRVLAEATDSRTDPDRRAWHRAHATAQLDESVAAELERSAERARSRGGIAAAAAFLERATELTPEPAERGRRALAAAQAKFESGAPEAAEQLLSIAETCPQDEFQRARVGHLRAQFAFVFTRATDGPRRIVDAARRLEPFDPALARDTYLEALGAAVYGGRLPADSGVVEIAEAARASAPAPTPPRATDLVLDGLAALCTQGPGAGVPGLRLAVETYREASLDGHDAIVRWLLLTPIFQSVALFELYDDRAFHALATRAARLARETGALALLPIALIFRSGQHLFAGEFAAASALVAEASTLAAATGNPDLMYARLPLDAWRGVDADASPLIALGFEHPVADARAPSMAAYGAAVLNNGLRRYGAAVEGAMRGSHAGGWGYAGALLPELVEAAARSDRPDVADAALARLDARARVAGTDWALATLARARALVSDGDAAEALYREAIDRLRATQVRLELARAQLLYGEWLRRADRRVDARVQLRAAHDTFADAGAQAFAERARHELSATGETVVRRTADRRDLLTPQEAQIAQMAASGQTNPQIGAQLFISPRTVEYHLRKVFTKLDVGSRRALGDRLSTA